jgi:hypothetical protein
VSDSRARIWFSLFVLAVFCLGGAGGFFLGRHVAPRPRSGDLTPLFGDAREFGRPGGPGRGGPAPFGRLGGPPLPPDLVNRLASELQLDGTQQDQVKKILDERRDRFEQVHREARESFGKEQRDLHVAIRAVLRPDQQQKFDKFLDRRR